MSLPGYKPKQRKAIWTTAFAVKQPEPKKRKWGIAAQSKYRQKRTYEYAKQAKAFVAAAIARGETCPVVAAIAELRNGNKYGHPISARLNEVHHKFGKIGRLLTWEPGFMAISKQGHRWVNANIEEARWRGWIGPLGTWNDYDRAVAFVQNNCCNKNQDAV